MSLQRGLPLSAHSTAAARECVKEDLHQLTGFCLQTKAGQLVSCSYPYFEIQEGLLLFFMKKTVWKSSTPQHFDKKMYTLLHCEKNVVSIVF